MPNYLYRISILASGLRETFLHIYDQACVLLIPDQHNDYGDTMDDQVILPARDFKSAMDENLRLQIIAGVIESVRPRIQQDNGDIELVSVDGLFVRVRLTGACVSCALAGQTLGGVRRELMAALNEPVRIVPVPLD